MYSNPYSQYKQQSVMTMTHGEMLITLFDGLIKHLNLAAKSIEGQDVTTANESLKRSQDILNYLSATLDSRYEVSGNLSMLYEFFVSQCVRANIKKDQSYIVPIIPMIQELRDTFEKADKMSRSAQQTAGSQYHGAARIGTAVG